MTQDLDPNFQQVNSFFAHWIKEIDITKYGTDKSLIQTTTPLEVYKYSDAMLKHLSKNVRKMIQEVAAMMMQLKEPMIISKIRKTNLQCKLIQNLCIEYR